MPVILSTKRADLPFTYRDYASWPDGERWELIDGVAYDMCAAPSRYHQSIDTVIAGFFFTYFRGKKCRCYIPPFDVILPEHDDDEIEDAITVVQPDMTVVCDQRKLIKQGCKGAPDLVVEILSPFTSKKDYNEKFGLYERVGVGEYWIINPGERVVELYGRGDGNRFGAPKVFVLDDRKPTEEVASVIFPGLAIPLAELFAQ